MKVTCQWDNPNKVSVCDDAFKGKKDDAALYVPKGTYNLYLSKTPWGYFNPIIEYNVSDGIIQLNADKNNIKVSVNGSTINLSGIRNYDEFEFYNLAGIRLGKAKVVDGSAQFNIGKGDEIVILKVENNLVLVDVR